MSEAITAAFYRGDKTFAVETKAPDAPGPGLQRRVKRGRRRHADSRGRHAPSTTRTFPFA